MRIPIANLRPAIDATEPVWRANLAALFEAGQFILGRQLDAFEREFAAAMGARFAVGVGSGTGAIELALRDAGVHGEVITPALTSPFTAAAIQAAGCRPRFTDVDPETLQMSVANLESRITGRTSAIVAVHLYGQPCGVPGLGALASRRPLVLVQDACQAHGAFRANKPLTTFSTYVCYSFYPTKNLGALGDGGAITTDNADACRRLRMKRDGGRGDTPQVAEVAGLNSRLDEMQCCYLRAFLPELSRWNRERRALAALYDRALADCPGVRPLARTPESVCHLYVVRADRREALRQHLEGHGIGTAIHYPRPLHLHPAFADSGQKRGDLPNAEKACEEIVSLPLWPGIGESAVLEVAERIREFYR
jgi:dTDP-3-amino-3,4,6-trideoxy-alpha-D-glucose transaminase